MATVVNTLEILVTAETDKAEKGLKKFQASAKKVGTNITKFVALPLAAAGAASLKFAIDAEETNAKFNTAFKGIEDTAAATAQSLAQNYGLARAESEKLLSGTGDLLKGFGFTATEALGLSNDVQQLAVDLSSYNNLQGGATRASEILTKALLGERDALVSLGVKISDADVQQRLLEKGQKDLTGQALLAAKAQATYELILEQTKDAQGDFARTSGSTANQLRVLQANVKDTAAELGKNLLPAFNGIVQDANFLVKGFNDLSPAAQTAVTGVAALTAAFGLLAVNPAFAAIALTGAAVVGLTRFARESKTFADNLDAVLDSQEGTTGDLKTDLEVVNKALERTQDFYETALNLNLGTLDATREQLAELRETNEVVDQYLILKDKEREIQNALTNQARNAQGLALQRKAAEEEAAKTTQEAAVQLTADQQKVIDVRQELINQLAVISQREQVFGEEIDAQSERTAAYQAAINDLVQNGFTAQGTGIQSIISLYEQLVPIQEEAIFKEVENRTELVNTASELNQTLLADETTTAATINALREESLKKELARQKELRKAAFGTFNGILAMAIDTYDGQAKVAEDASEKEKKAAREAFETAKGLRVAEALISTATGAINAYSSFAALGPLGIVAGIAAAAAITTFGLKQVATIQKQQPSFALGTPDEGFTVPPGFENDNFPVFAQSGETVNVEPADNAAQGSRGKMTQLILQIGEEVLGDIIFDGTQNGTIRVSANGVVAV